MRAGAKVGDVSDQTSLIVQIPAGGSLERALREQPLPGAVVVETAASDPDGHLEPIEAGEVVFSAASPAALERERDELRQVLTNAGKGVEPLVIRVEAAEELTEAELAGVLDSARHSSRAVILRVERNA